MEKTQFGQSVHQLSLILVYSGIDLIWFNSKSELCWDSWVLMCGHWQSENTVSLWGHICFLHFHPKAACLGTAVANRAARWRFLGRIHSSAATPAFKRLTAAWENSTCCMVLTCRKLFEADAAKQEAHNSLILHLENVARCDVGH